MSLSQCRLYKRQSSNVDESYIQIESPSVLGPHSSIGSKAFAYSPLKLNGVLNIDSTIDVKEKNKIFQSKKQIQKNPIYTKSSYMGTMIDDQKTELNIDIMLNNLNELLDQINK
jgi:hypothetical protein